MHSAQRIFYIMLLSLEEAVFFLFFLFLEIIISIHGSHAVRCRLFDLAISTGPLFLLQARYVYAGSGMSTFLSWRGLRLCCEVPSGRCETPCFAFIVSVAAGGMLFALLCGRGAVVSATRRKLCCWVRPFFSNPCSHMSLVLPLGLLCCRYVLKQ